MTLQLFDTALKAAKRMHFDYPEILAFTEWDDLAKYQYQVPFGIPVSDNLPADQTLQISGDVALIEAFSALAPIAKWRQTYRSEDIGQTFNNRFGCYQLIGEDGHFFSNQLNTYLVYAEADLYYPWHAHPAEELYVIVAGEALFEADGRPPRVLRPGDTAFHASNQAHAMTTHDRSVLAYVLWRGDLKTKPVLTRSQHPVSDIPAT